MPTPYRWTLLNARIMDSIFIQLDAQQQQVQTKRQMVLRAAD